jgi:hypothetical protein
LVEGKKQLEFRFLAARIVVGRLVRNYSLDPTPATKTKCVNELISFFKGTVHIPCVQTDLAAIFGGKRS